MNTRRWLGISALVLLMATVFWWPTIAQNAAGLLSHQDASNTFTGNNQNFFFAGAVARPIPPVATQAATSGGACQNATTYRFYVSFKNATGETTMSPPSIEFKPASGTTNKVRLTMPDGSIGSNVNTWAVWYTRDTDNHATTRGCSTSGDVSYTEAATRTFDCVCGTTNDPTEPSSNTTHNAYALKVAINPASVGITFPEVKTVDICPVGCLYATLSDACAAVTSTASAPVRFYVHAGLYAAADTMCSGQDHASFVGDGIGVTILQGLDHGFGDEYASTNCTSTPKACKAALNLGTSKNIEVHDMSFKGSRGIWWTGQTVGGATGYIHDNYFETTTQNLDEDCFFIDRMVAGTDITFKNNRCNSWGDGFTLNQSTDVRIHGSGNTWTNPSTTLLAIGAAWAFRAIPCFFDSSGDMVNYVGSRPGGAAGASFYGYYFTGEDAATCASGAQIRITSPNIYLNNTTGNGFTSVAEGIFIKEGAAGLSTFDVTNPQIRVTASDTTTGQVQGIINKSTSIIPNIVGGYVRATGGLASSTKDITVSPGDTTVKVNVTGVDFTSDAGSVNLIVAGDQRWLASSRSSIFSNVFTINLANGNIPTIKSTDTLTGGLLLDNTDTGTTETSPTLQLKPGTTSDAGWRFYADGNANATLRVLETAGAGERLSIDSDGKVQFTGTTNGQSFSISNPGVGLSLGDGAANDNTLIRFNGTVDLLLQWIESATRLNLNGATIIRHTTAAAPPSACVQGDMYFDTSGAVCWCTTSGTPGTWTNSTGVGACT